LFNWCYAAYPDLTYYDADIPVALRLSAPYAIYPLCYCEFETNGDELLSLRALQSPWTLDFERPPLRTLTLELERSPYQTPPTHLLVRWPGRNLRLPFKPARPFLINLAGILKQVDPDVLLAYWGDSWLLPTLLELSKQYHLPLRSTGMWTCRRSPSNPSAPIFLWSGDPP